MKRIDLPIAIKHDVTAKQFSILTEFDKFCLTVKDKKLTISGFFEIRNKKGTAYEKFVNLQSFLDHMRLKENGLRYQSTRKKPNSFLYGIYLGETLLYGFFEDEIQKYYHEHTQPALSLGPILSISPPKPIIVPDKLPQSSSLSHQVKIGNAVYEVTSKQSEGIKEFHELCQVAALQYAYSLHRAYQGQQNSSGVSLGSYLQKLSGFGLGYSHIPGRYSNCKLLLGDKLILSFPEDYNGTMPAIQFMKKPIPAGTIDENSQIQSTQTSSVSEFHVPFLINNNSTAANPTMNMMVSSNLSNEYPQTHSLFPNTSIPVVRNSLIPAINDIEKSNIDESIYLLNNHNLFFQPMSSEKTFTHDTNNEKEIVYRQASSPAHTDPHQITSPPNDPTQTSIDDLISANASEKFSLFLNNSLIKTEPIQENNQNLAEIGKPILKLSIKQLKKVINILRGDDYDFDALYTNCALFSEEIIKYFQTSIMPTTPVAKNYSTDQFATDYQTELIVLPNTNTAVKIKQELTKPSLPQPQSRHFTRSKKVNQPQEVLTIVNSSVDRSTRLGARASYDVSYPSSSGKIDLTTPIINLESSTQMQSSIHNLSKNLKYEASRNPNCVTFGIIGLESCGDDIKKKLGHMLVYYSTMREVTYIDATLKQSIFKDLSKVYKFAEAGKKIDEETFGYYIFSSPMGPLVQPNKNLEQQNKNHPC